MDPDTSVAASANQGASLGLPPKRLHWALVAFLLIVIVLAALFLLANGFLLWRLERRGPADTPVLLVVTTLRCAADIIFAIALFNRRRWGFYGIVVTTIVGAFEIAFAGDGVVRSLSALLRVPLLYWLLNLGGSRKAWPRLT